MKNMSKFVRFKKNKIKKYIYYSQVRNTYNTRRSLKTANKIYFSVAAITKIINQNAVSGFRA